MFVFIIFPNQANIYQISYNVNLFSGLESQKVHFCSLNQVKGNYTSNIVTVSIINNSDKQHKAISKIHSISEMFLTTHSFYLIQRF